MGQCALSAGGTTIRTWSCTGWLDAWPALIHLDSADLPDLVPTDFEADAVITLRLEGAPVLSVVLEIQLRFEEDKPWVWPAYLANLRARRRCDVLLVVICLNTRTAKRCGRPIDLGHPGFVLTPRVIGPRVIPRVTDVDQARALPALAVLSALAHPRDTAVLAVVPEALSPLNPGVFAGYYRLIEAALPAAGRRFLEVLLTTKAPYKSTFANKLASQHHDEGFAEGRTAGLAEGRTAGLAEGVLALLDDRHVRLTQAARDRITACRDESQLKVWPRRAASATTSEDLFA